VFPAVHDFGLLALVLAVVFLPLGLMLHHPKSALFALPLTVNPAALLSLQNTYSANIQTFLNSSIAMFIGIGFAVVMTRLFRSVGAEWTARRLVRQGWTTLAEAAEGRGQQDRQRFAARMLDLLGLLAPRLAATPEGSDIASVDMLNEARIGLNIPCCAAPAGTCRAQPRSGRAHPGGDRRALPAADCRAQADGGGWRCASGWIPRWAGLAAWARARPATRR
jgi:uncharacterized membrane protein YccC